jgi:hypothetical protein
MTRKHWQLLFIILAFSGPVLVALAMQTPWFHWEPASTRNHGRLIQPVVPTGDLALSDLQGQPLSTNSGSNVWTLLKLGEGACDARCQEQLELLARVRDLQVQRADQLRVVHLDLNNAAAVSTDRWIEARAADPAAWRQRLESQRAVLFLIDPLGNAMMSYSIDYDPTGVRKDVAVLLRWSKVDAAS